MAMAESGHLVCPIPTITYENKGAVGEPDEQQSQQSAHQLGGCAVGTVLLGVEFGIAVEVDQDRQSPASCGEGEFDEDGQDDPLVAVPPGRVGMSGPDRIAVSSLAIDLGSSVPIDGVVPDENDGSSGNELSEEECSQKTGQFECGPGCS
jgi:hypothetical protein